MFEAWRAARRAQAAADAAEQSVDEIHAINACFRKMMEAPPPPSPGHVRGERLKVPLPDGRTLFGMACVEHGIRYLRRGYVGDMVVLSEVECYNGADPPESGPVICDVCGKLLAGPMMQCAYGEVREEVLQKLREVAEGVGDG
jgi:hypothetical protein